MKKIEAIIRPEFLLEIKDVLEKYDLNGLSFTQVMGCGSQKGWQVHVRGSEVDYNFLSKIKIELVVLDEQVQSVIDYIIETTSTGEPGDGKIFVYDVIEAVRVRTNERGEDAIK